MNAVITFNPVTRTHQWSTVVYDLGEWCFGVAVDAEDRVEAMEKINRLWEDYQRRRAALARRRRRNTGRRQSGATGGNGRRPARS